MQTINRFKGEKELPANVLYAADLKRGEENKSLSGLAASAARVATSALSRPSSANSTASRLSGISVNNIKMRWRPKTARKRRTNRKSRRANRKSRRNTRRN